jgi:glutathione S-transferase
MMTFYGLVGSPNSRKVEAVLNHTCLAARREFLGIFEGDLKTPEYLALNPNGKVPCLVDEGFVLWESNAIMQYLADKAGHPTLFPRDARQRADVVRWQCWELAHYNKALGILAFETVAKPGFNLGTPIQALIDISLEQLKQFAPVLDQHLRGRTHVSGDQLTIADYSMVHLEWFRTRTPFDWSPYPHLNAYYDRIAQIEHWVKTAPASPAEMGRRRQVAA